MSHLNAHFLKFRDQNFVFDIGKTTAARATVKFTEGLTAYQKGGFEEAFQNLSSHYDKGIATTTCQHIQRMVAAGWFRPFPQPEITGYSNPILHLSLSRQSNIAPLINSYRDERNMSPEIVSRAIALGFQTIAKAATFLEVRVGQTGDPLKNMPALNRLFDLAANSRNIRFKELASDGTQDVRNVALEKRMHVRFDIGGTPQIQDKLWPMADGSPSSSLVECNTRAWIQSASSNRAVAYAQITGTYATEVADSYQYLYDLGFRKIRLQPLRNGPAPHAIDEQTVEKVISAYERFVELLLRMNDDLLLAYLNALWGPDLLGQFLVGLLTHEGSVSSCPAGKALLSVDVDGRVYACARFSGFDEHCLGTLEKGLNERSRWPYMEDLLVDRRHDCSSCWARYLCGGGCPYSAVRKTCDLKAPDSAHCRLTRHLASLAIWLLDVIQADRPQVMRALLCNVIQPSIQTGLKCPISDVPITDQKQIVEQGLLLPLASGDQVRGHVWRGPKELSGKCSVIADGQFLHAFLEISGSAYKPNGSVERSDFITIRFAPQPDNERLTSVDLFPTDYTIAGGNPVHLMTTTPAATRGAALRKLGRTAAGGYTYWFCLPWAAVSYEPRPNGVFGFNLQIGIKSQGEEFCMNCFPAAVTGIVTLDCQSMVTNKTQLERK